MAAIKTEYITSEDIKLLNLCSRDPWEFSKHIYVMHPIRGKVRFLLYPFQKILLWNFINNRFNIVLKFRQAGVTELISLYCLWLAMFHPNKNIQIISIKDRVAKKVLRKIKYMYRNLPVVLKTPIVNGRPGDIGTATEMEFSNGSMITSIPTTEDAGRSEALSLLVIDEGAIVKWASKIWAAAFPTLSTGGSAIVNSTPYGVGNWYHQTWVDACVGGNGFVPVRLKWDMHPERDIKWYTQMRNALGAKRTAQEIDGDFLSSGDTVFDLVDIKSIEDDLADNQPIERRLNGNLLIFEKPRANGQYYIGADVATGRARDYSAFSVMDRYGSEVAAFKGRITVDKYKTLLGNIGKDYNYALLAPETDGVGEGLVRWLQDDGYSNLYYTKQMLRQKGKSKPEMKKVPGWVTTGKNRPIIIDELEQDIRNEEIQIRDPFFVQEAYTFIYDERNTPIAMGKKNKHSAGDDEDEGTQDYTDDAILAKAITNFIRKGRNNPTLISPI